MKVKKEGMGMEEEFDMKILLKKMQIITKNNGPTV